MMRILYVELNIYWNLSKIRKSSKPQGGIEPVTTVTELQSLTIRPVIHRWTEFCISVPSIYWNLSKMREFKSHVKSSSGFESTTSTLLIHAHTTWPVIHYFWKFCILLPKHVLHQSLSLSFVPQFQMFVKFTKNTITDSGSFWLIWDLIFSDILWILLTEHTIIKFRFSAYFDALNKTDNIWK